MPHGKNKCDIWHKWTTTHRQNATVGTELSPRSLMAQTDNPIDLFRMMRDVHPHAVTTTAMHIQ